MKLRTLAAIFAASLTCLISSQALACSATTACINEVFVSFNGTPQTMADEYLELRGPAGTAFDEGTYFVTLEGDKNAGPGSVDSVIDLGGLTFGSNGFMVLLAQGNIYTVDALAATYTSNAAGFSGLGMNEPVPRQRWFSDPGVTNYERPSATYLILTAPVRPNLNDDIDTVGGSGNPPRGDGFPDGPVWDSWTVIDSVGAADNPNGDFSYGFINYRTGGTSGIGITVPITARPNYVGRFGDSFGSTVADWVESGVPTGTRPNFFLGTAVPQGVQGKPLNHIGSTNAWTNIAPVNTLPATATTAEDVALAFPGTVSILDADAGQSLVEVTVAATNGTFSLSQTTNLVFSVGDGTNDATMTFRGTVRNLDNTSGGTINAALAGASFLPALHFAGTGRITVTTNDLGNTGTSGALSDTDALDITVTPIDDAPVATFAIPASNEDAGAQTVVGSLSPGGGADEAAQTVSVTNVAVTATTGGLTFTTQPAIDAGGVLTYEAAADSSGTATVSVTITDSGSNVAPSVNEATQAFTITVNAVNDEPTFTLAAGLAPVEEDAGAQSIAAFAGGFDAGPADEDAGQALSAYTVSVTGTTGTLAFAAGPAIALDGTLSYTPAADTNGTATVSVSVTDDGGTANGGDDTSAAQTFTIEVTAVNDTPAFTLGGNQTVESDDGAQSLPGFASSITNGGADEAGQVLTFAVSNDNNALFASQPAISSAGVLSYTPAFGADGSAIVSVTLGDDAGATSAAQTFTITVTPPLDSVPFATSITRIGANPATSSPVQFSVVFSENVTAVDSGDFALVVTGTVTGQLIQSVACVNDTCTVTVSITDGAGTLRLNLVDNDTILDSANQPLAGTINGSLPGPAFDIEIEGAGDNVPPAVVSVVRANPSPSPGPTVAFIVTFSEPVTGIDTADFALTLTGSLATPAISSVSSGGNTYVVTVATGTGVGTIRLDVMDDDSVLDIAANPLGGVNTGNGAFTTGQVYAIDTINAIPIFSDGFENPPAQ